MAKGRKLTTSRSEHFFGYGTSYSTGNSVTGVTELGEDEVWSTGDHRINGDDHHPINGTHSVWSSSESNGSYAGTAIKPHRRGKREEQLIGGLSLAFEDSGNTLTPNRIVVQKYTRHQESVDSTRGDGRQMATSVPMNVPDWRKFNRVDSFDSMQDSPEDWSDRRESEGLMVPPHEYLAREYSRSGKMTAATSVFEGVGRTLKGRDLRRVRDAVWSQTGFDGHKLIDEPVLHYGEVGIP